MATSDDLFILKSIPIKQALGLTDKPNLAQVCSNMLRKGYAPAHFVPTYGPSGKQEAVMILGIVDPSLVSEIEAQVKRARTVGDAGDKVPEDVIASSLAANTAVELATPEIVAAK